MRRQFIVTGFIALAVVAGCSRGWQSDYSQLGLIEVSGRITLDGVPLAASTVVFESPDKSFSYGIIDEQGNYALMFNSEKRGALPGLKTVRIRSSPAAGGEMAPNEHAAGTLPKPANSIPPCYGANSQLRVTLSGRSQTVDFDLKSDGSTLGPAG